MFSGKDRENLEYTSFSNKNFPQENLLDFYNETWKACRKSLAKVSDLNAQNLKVVLGRRIFSKHFSPKNFIGKIESRFDKFALFSPKIKTIMLKSTEKVTIFFTEKNSSSKRSLWTFKKQFWKSCSELFAKKPNTDLTKHQEKSWREFLSTQWVF